MKKTGYTVLIFLIVFLMISIAANASSRKIASNDRVSTSDWSYDALISLSSDGLVPGYASRVFQGDRIFDRMEIADLIISIIESSETENLTDSQISLINKLVLDYKPEINSKNPDIAETWESYSNIKAPITATGYLQAKYNRNIYEDDSIDMPFSATGFSDINDHIFAVGTISDKTKQFNYTMRDPSTPDKLSIKGNDANFFWTVGKDYSNWSPSYNGSMILSDTSRSFFQLKGGTEIDLGKWIGRLKITQFVSQFSENGDNVYLLGRRYEKPLSKNLSLGLSETAKTDKAPNITYAIMPFYLAQHIGDDDFNIFGAIDLVYKMKNDVQIYTDFMVDDMSDDKIFSLGRNDWRRKTGYTIGTYIPKIKIGENESNFRAEFISIDPKTYSPVSMSKDLPYYHKSMLIGHPIGPNVNALYLRGEHYFTPKLSMIAEYLNQKQKKNEEPFRASSHTLSLQVSYDFTPSTSLSLRVAPTKVKSQMMTPYQYEAESESGTEYEIKISQSF